ncbi:hypothetical protein K491DRAFT_226962 [Lophiostoma macrostomum CBS 122681]|uniref:Uncharacterized protein n=1 Tax=Lophiostoma macrostomum CBS 122681 TaxID=1314788 RepID=A0A6A6TJC1_9PLEO|nr:hypothetical protein K491DRAFT_226962 [Lophiostoma macrostomum CBS 122681]
MNRAPSRPNQRTRNPDKILAMWFYGLDPSHSWDTVHARSRLQFLLLLPCIQTKACKRESMEYCYMEAFIEAFCNPHTFRRRQEFVEVWTDAHEDILQFMDEQFRLLLGLVTQLRSQYGTLEHAPAREYTSPESRERGSRIRALALVVLKCIIEGKPQPCAQFSLPDKETHAEASGPREQIHGEASRPRNQAPEENPLVKALQTKTGKCPHPKDVGRPEWFPEKDVIRPDNFAEQWPRMAKVATARSRVFRKPDGLVQMLLGMEELLGRSIFGVDWL